METYKIGNKIKCTISTYAPITIGDTQLLYDQQPYTVLNEVEARLTFDDIDTVERSVFNQLVYNNANLRSILFSDVTLNNKILNLIFHKIDAKLCRKSENCNSDNKILYLSTGADVIYQVFIYDADGQLAAAFGSYDNPDEGVQLPEEIEDGNFIVFYSIFSSLSYEFKNNPNNYYTLDLEITGNKNDTTHTMFIHLDKCGLQIDKNMVFNRNANAVDLRFTIIDNNNNYIALE